MRHGSESACWVLLAHPTRGVGQFQPRSRPVTSGYQHVFFRSNGHEFNPMTRNTPPQPPKHLSAVAKQFWRSVCESFDIDSHSLDLLEVACVQLQRAEQARVIIAKEGMIIVDRFDQPKPHPGIEMERQASMAFVRIGRELGLSVEAPDSRPPLPVGYK